MYNAFQNAWEFNQDISGWNTEKVVSMRQTFRLAKKFNQDISGWQIPLVNDRFSAKQELEDLTKGL